MVKLVIVALLGVFLPISAFACAEEEESHALDVRALKSSMMVAALSCDQQSQYNKFVRKYQDNFADGGEDINAYFKRTYGADYKKQLNRFVTRLANEATKKSMNGDPEAYCEETAAIFDELFSLRKGKLDEFAGRQQLATLHGVNSCS